MQTLSHPKTKIASALVGMIASSGLPFLICGLATPASAQTSVIPLSSQPGQRTVIRHFEVRGASSLSAEQIAAATAPYVGWEQTPGTIKKAIEAIEMRFRAHGKQDAQVFLAGEDKDKGIVFIDLVDSVTPPTVLPGTTAAAATSAIPAAVSPPTAIAAERFTIKSYEVKGVATLRAEDVGAVTARHVGPNKGFGDIQQAVDAIEGLYRSRGYGAVQVLLPEQDISQGVIAIEVIETPIGKVVVTGRQRYSEANIRRSLPVLQEGRTPNARAISQSVQLANENQAKQLEVVLAVGAQENTVDARVEVKEDAIQRFFLTADNTGTKSTGEYRVGVGYIHNNLFDRDHTASLAYTTTPDAPSSVDINVFSINYRLPFYSLGDSLGLLYGYSDVSTPAAQATGFAINGKGSVFALRWNHYLPRQGEYSSQLLAELNWKRVESSCQDINGNPVVGTAGCIDYDTTPLSLAYSGRKEGIGNLLEFNFGLTYNVPSGQQYAYTTSTTSGSDHYTLAAGNRQVKDDFAILRLAGTYTGVVKDWMARVAVNGQYTPDGAMVGSEQIGLAGSQAVRGFLDRIVVADSGAVLNLEAYTPELAPLLGMPAHNLRALAFIDYGYGRDNNATAVAVKELGSWGLGLRYQYRKDVSFKLDAASILLAKPDDVYRGTDPAGGVLDSNGKNDWRLHASLMISF